MPSRSHSATEFDKNLLIGSGVIGGQTDRLTERENGDIISLAFLYKESRLKRGASC
jgi:hypothetical protein